VNIDKALCAVAFNNATETPHRVIELFGLLDVAEMTCVANDFKFRSSRQFIPYRRDVILGAPNQQRGNAKVCTTSRVLLAANALAANS
jgi:hypothetical protein